MDFARLFSIIADEGAAAKDDSHDGPSFQSHSKHAFANNLDQVTLRGITFRKWCDPSFLDLGSLGAAHQWLNDSVEAIEASPEACKDSTFLLLLRCVPEHDECNVEYNVAVHNLGKTSRRYGNDFSFSEGRVQVQKSTLDGAVVEVHRILTPLASTFWFYIQNLDCVIAQLVTPTARRNATLRSILSQQRIYFSDPQQGWPKFFLGGVHLSLTDEIERIGSKILEVQGPTDLTRLNGANTLRISREAVHLSNQCVYFEQISQGLVSATALILSKPEDFLPCLYLSAESQREVSSLKERFERAGSYCVGGRERCATLIRGVQIVIAQRDQEATLKLAAESTNIARASWQDTTSMTAITVITMIFLPGTFTATLFSMPWFEDLAGNGNATIQMKVYTILTVLLTAGVISGWRVWCRIRRKRRIQEISAQIDNKLEGRAISGGVENTPA
ncbi:hypothetical protein BN1723_014479 [Verticillium longisporum]|uniref:Uncharacterized protein n=2 Tax=Verticillium longisporum TaxID=100787 RepID=A0A0G4MBL2_VERLO|nr:hypothetical protein BN1723_014479 [Verticillium longisporum]